MLLNPSLAIAQAVLSSALRFISLHERWINTSLPAYSSGLPSASGLSCGLPPALSVIEAQSIAAACANSVAKSRVAVAFTSSIVPRVVTSSTPRAKWLASAKMSGRPRIADHHKQQLETRRHEDTKPALRRRKPLCDFVTSWFMFRPHRSWLELTTQLDRALQIVRRGRRRDRAGAGQHEAAHRVPGRFQDCGHVVPHLLVVAAEQRVHGVDVALDEDLAVAPLDRVGQLDISQRRWV